MGLPGTEHRPENDLANKPTCENGNFNHLLQGSTNPDTVFYLYDVRGTF